jgi:putative membrane protein
MERWILAALHLLGLGIGLGAIWVRGAALRGTLDMAGLRRVLVADNAWAVAAGLWIVTGLLRAFTGYEKGADYYLGNELFLAKMAALVLIVALEIWPMITLVRWRTALGRGQAIDTTPARAFARISTVQLVLVLLMVVAATGMARGFGFWM